MFHRLFCRDKKLESDGDGMSDCPCLIDAASKNTNCECTAPGWCSRHKCHKPEHFFNLCRMRPDYFALYEAGRGPGQDIPAAAHPQVDPPGTAPIGLGDVVGWMASLVGVKPWPGCGCSARKAWLNRFIVWGWWRGHRRGQSK
jgi:hypothetical protein